MFCGTNQFGDAMCGAAADVDPAALEDFVRSFSDGGAHFDERVVVGFVAEAKEGVAGDRIHGGLVIEFEDGSVRSVERLVEFAECDGFAFGGKAIAEI